MRCTYPIEAGVMGLWKTVNGSFAFSENMCEITKCVYFTIHSWSIIYSKRSKGRYSPDKQAPSCWVYCTNQSIWADIYVRICTYSLASQSLTHIRNPFVCNRKSQLGQTLWHRTFSNRDISQQRRTSVVCRLWSNYKQTHSKPTTSSRIFNIKGTKKREESLRSCGNKENDCLRAALNMLLCFSKTLMCVTTCDQICVYIHIYTFFSAVYTQEKKYIYVWYDGIFLLFIHLMFGLV